jgi:mannose-6-phosphate isomerase-like protein (cupin superfamily)
MNKTLFAKLHTLEEIATAHQVGKKRVFLRKDNVESSLTQFAYGELGAGEGVEMHRHPTMEEYFFFLTGKGIFNIGDESFLLSKDVFIHVPADVPHQMMNDGTEQLTFVYFGIAI